MAHIGFTAVRARARRLPGAGRGRRGRARPRAGQGDGVGGRVRAGDGDGARRHLAEVRARSAFRRSASAPARTATARCSCGRTRSGCAPGGWPSSSSSTPTCTGCCSALQDYAADVAAGTFPGPEHTFDGTSARDEQHHREPHRDRDNGQPHCTDRVAREPCVASTSNCRTAEARRCSQPWQRDRGPAVEEQRDRETADGDERPRLFKGCASRALSLGCFPVTRIVNETRAFTTIGRHPLSKTTASRNRDTPAVCGSFAHVYKKSYGRTTCWPSTTEGDRHRVGLVTQEATGGCSNQDCGEEVAGQEDGREEVARQEDHC